MLWRREKLIFSYDEPSFSSNQDCRVCHQLIYLCEKLLDNMFIGDERSIFRSCNAKKIRSL